MLHTPYINSAVVKPPATTSVTLKVCKLPENAPTIPASTRDAPERAILPARLPSLDQDGEEVFVFDRGTKVVQDQSGKIWTLLAKPNNPEAAEKQAKMVYPVEINDPCRGIPGLSADRPCVEITLDLDGRVFNNSQVSRRVYTVRWIKRRTGS